MNEKIPVYGSKYFDTLYQIDDIKIAIVAYLDDETKSYSNGGNPLVIRHHLLNNAINNKKLVGFEDEFIHYVTPYFSSEAEKKINIALNELLLEKKLYYDFFDSNFKILK